MDSFVLPNKRTVLSFSLLLALTHIPQIAYYQIIQKGIDKVGISIVEEKSRLREAVNLQGKWDSTTSWNA